jgi:hypothetical protein
MQLVKPAAQSPNGATKPRPRKQIAPVIGPKCFQGINVNLSDKHPRYGDVVVCLNVDPRITKMMETHTTFEDCLTDGRLARRRVLDSLETFVKENW